MAKWANPFRNTEFKTRPAPRKLKVILLVLVLACVAAMLALGVVQYRIRQQTKALMEQAAALEQQNATLSQSDEDAIREIAKEELDLADPDTIIFDPN